MICLGRLGAFQRGGGFAGWGHARWCVFDGCDSFGLLCGVAVFVAVGGFEVGGAVESDRDADGGDDGCDS